MAINTIELVKNKNYGFQLTAPDLFVDILTLDLLSGVCTSSYFDSPELAQFRRTALELFTIVSPPERAPGALNLLNRLVAVAAADDATVTRSVSIVGDLATLRISVDANPGSFVAHVPFSGDGALAWAGDNASGGGGGSVNSVSATFPIVVTGPGTDPDVGITVDSVVTNSLVVLPSGLAVNTNTSAGIQSVLGSGVEVKIDTAAGLGFNLGGAIAVKVDPGYYDFSSGPGDLTPLDSGVVAGIYGDASNVAQIDVDVKGRVLSVTNVPIAAAAVPLTLNDVFVAINGSDVTGDGSISKPFATVGAAMASITLATSTNRYAIRLAAGEYAEPGTLLLKPDVFIVGEGWENTVLDADVELDASYGAAVDPFSGLYNVAVTGTVDIDVEASGNATGRFNAVNTRFNDALTLSAFANTNIFGVVRCVTGVGVSATFNGGDVFSFGTLYQGPISVDESASAAFTNLTSASDTFNGNLTATNAGGTPSGSFVLTFAGSSIGYDGTSLSTRATASFTGDMEVRATSNYVADATTVTLAGGATLTPWSDAWGVGYVPANAGDWLSVPTAVNTALDELASRVAAGLVNWTEGTTTYSGRVINDFTVDNAAAAVDAAIVAKGTGATVAQIADGTAAGGDVRGTYATDWQKFRALATEVASGAQAVIAGGVNNTASGLNSVAVGGAGNTASGTQSAVVGGGSNTASNTSAFVGAGSACVASGLRASVVGGLNNQATGAAAGVLNGTSNQATGAAAGILGGASGIASGNNSAVLNGNTNTADSLGEIVGGLFSWTFPGSSSTTYAATDPLLVIGNGTSNAARSNGLVLLKNGFLGLGLGVNKPEDMVHAVGNVRNTGAIVQDGFTSGAAITAGQVCYLAADGKVYAAQANATSTSTVVGIAVETVGAADVEIALATFNKTGNFAGLTTGTEYFLSATVAGAVVDYATLSATSGAEIVSLGYARSATEIQLSIQRRGVTP